MLRHSGSCVTITGIVKEEKEEKEDKEEKEEKESGQYRTAELYLRGRTRATVIQFFVSYRS